MRKYLAETLVCVAIITCFSSCKKTAITENGESQVETFTFNNNSNYKAITESRIGDVSFVNIDEDSNHLIRMIDKAVINDHSIYLFDRMGAKSLNRHGLDGTFQNSYGSIGEGPEEFLRIWDFDVLDNRVFILDELRNSLFSFTDDGELEWIKNIPDFKPDHFLALPSGDFIFATFDGKEASQLVLTDADLNIKERILENPEGSVNDKLSNRVLQRVSGGIMYNRPPCNTLYFISEEGDILKSINCDFDKKNLPERLQLSYQALVDDGGKDKYSFFTESPLIIGDFMLGYGFADGGKSIFVYDMQQQDGAWKTFKTPQLSLHDILMPLCATDSTVISYIDNNISDCYIDKESIPENVLKHLDDGNKTLIIHHINASRKL